MKTTPSLLLSVILLALPLLAQDGISTPITTAAAAPVQADLLSPDAQAQVQHTQSVLESTEMQKIAQRSPAIKSMMARELAALRDAAAAQADGDAQGYATTTQDNSARTGTN